MIFAYGWSLLVFISMTEGQHEVYIHQYATFAECKAVERDTQTGIDKTNDPNTVVIGCRQNLSINAGSDAKWPMVAK